MTQINPLIGSVLQSTAVQRAQAAEKSGHVQRAQVRSKDSASSGDQFEHQVESSDALAQIHDEDPKRRQHRQSRHPANEAAGAADETGAGEAEGSSHIDVKV